MDITDKKILAILSKNANASGTEISACVNLSIPAVNKRILRLQESGMIRGFTVLTDAKKIGKPVIAYILLVLQHREGIDNLMECINRDDDVLECHAVTGEYDYIIKICAASVESLEEKLLNLKKQKGVIKSHTMLSLLEYKFSPTVLPDADEH